MKPKESTVDVIPGLRRIVAPNPSPMTLHGTNTYLVGSGEVAVIDPGPNLPQHLAAILGCLRPGEKISHIFVTHSHLDHSPLARPLAQATKAPVLAFGDSLSGRSPAMQRLADAGLLQGGEGVDTLFSPDIILQDQQIISHGEWQLQALHTPGHMANHLCFAWQDILFSGDHVMGWASSLVSPPDGDMTAFMASLARLQQREWQMFFPGHGAEIIAPRQRLEELRQHRLGREHAILAHLAKGPVSIKDITKTLYQDTPTALLPAAQRNVLAHLIDLHQRGLVAAEPKLSPLAVFRLMS